MEFMLLATFGEIMAYVGYVLLAILILLIMITVHELGHYLVGFRNRRICDRVWT